MSSIEALRKLTKTKPGTNKPSELAESIAQHWGADILGLQANDCWALIMMALDEAVQEDEG